MNFPFFVELEISGVFVKIHLAARSNLQSMVSLRRSYLRCFAKEGL